MSIRGTAPSISYFSKLERQNPRALQVCAAFGPAGDGAVGEAEGPARSRRRSGRGGLRPGRGRRRTLRRTDAAFFELRSVSE